MRGMFQLQFLEPSMQFPEPRMQIDCKKTWIKEKKSLPTQNNNPFLQCQSVVYFQIYFFNQWLNSETFLECSYLYPNGNRADLYMLHKESMRDILTAWTVQLVKQLFHPQAYYTKSKRYFSEHWQRSVGKIHQVGYWHRQWNQGRWISRIEILAKIKRSINIHKSTLNSMNISQPWVVRNSANIAIHRT